jgi:hypothetical protein
MNHQIIIDEQWSQVFQLAGVIFKQSFESDGVALFR